MKFTQKQGQYLAYIDLYTRLNRRPPAEADIQAYFRATAPSVHQMIERLTRNGLISRIPHQPRTIKILVPREELPTLE